MKNSAYTILVSSIITLVAFGALFTWMLGKVHTNMKKVAEIKMELEEHKGESGRARILESLLKDSVAEKEQLEKVLVAPGAVVDVLHDLERMGEYAGVKVSVRSIKEEEDTIDISLGFSGTFKQLRHVSALLANMPRAIFVDSLHITKQKGKGLWNGTANLTAFKSKI